MKLELKAAKEINLEDAINQRRIILAIVKSVQKEVTPNDPIFKEEPIFIPSYFKDPFDRLNRPWVVDYQEGIVGAGDDDYAHNSNIDPIYDLEEVEDVKQTAMEIERNDS